MTDLTWAAALAFIPLAAALAAYPRRAWAGLAAGAAALGLGFARSAAAGPSWLLLAGASAGACAYVAFRTRRSAAQEEGWRAQLETRRAQAAEMTERLNRLKKEGTEGEKAQKKAMTIYGIVKGLSEALDWETMRPKMEGAVHQVLGLEEFALYVSDMRFEETMHPLVKRRLVGSVGAQWDTLSKHLAENKLSLREAHALPAPQSSVAVPIRHGQEMVGYLFGRVRAGKDPAELLDAAKEFGEEIAFALKRVRLFQEVERLSEMDGLTGVYRRVMWDQRIKEEVLRARTFRTTFCVLLLDIDHFKRLNDTYGHQFGDAVLRKMGEVLRKSVYDTDFVARYGGEEFAILLPRADPSGVMIKAERIRQNVAKEVFSHGLESIKVSVSIGVAHFPRDGQTGEEVVGQADRALYAAKEQGRDRVVDVAEVERGAA